MISKVFFLTTFLLLSICFKPIYGKHTTPLEILFIANTNALLENCHCGNPSLGGLARIVTIVEKERQKNPDVVFIDGGNFFNSYPFFELNKTVLDIYSYIKPDLLVPGENEFIDELTLITQFIENNPKNIVCTNYKIGNLDVSVYRKYSDIVFLSFLDKTIIQSYNNDTIIFDNNRFKAQYEKFKNLYLIVLYRGYDSIKKFINMYPEINMILSTHAQAGVVEKYSNTNIIGSGNDGEYVIKITLDTDKKVSVKLLPVNLDIEQNKHVMKYVNHFKEVERIK